MENNVILQNNSGVAMQPKRSIFDVLEEKRDFFIESCTKVLEMNERYDGNVSTKSLIQNLNLWAKNKESLFNLFRQSPDWNEEELCLTTQLDYVAKPDTSVLNDIFSKIRNNCNNVYKRNIVNGLWSLLSRVENNVINDVESFHVWSRSITDLNSYDCTSNHSANYILEKYNVRVGQKFNKVVRKVLVAEDITPTINFYDSTSLRDYFNGVSKRNEDGNGYTTIWDYDFEKWYAKFSDLCIPRTEKRTFYISLNPMDYLTQSHGNVSWGSCHSIENDGCYHSATLTMMVDATTLIVYTLPKKVENNFWSYGKLARQSLFIGENFNVILQNVFYPSRDLLNSKLVREYLEKLICDICGFNNTWIIPTLRDVRIDTTYYLGYEDWNAGKPYECAKLKDSQQDYRITIGNKAYCVDTPYEYICEHDRMDYYEGDNYCECCERYTNEDVCYVRNYGYVCEHCLNNGAFVWAYDVDEWCREDDCYYAEDTGDWYYYERSVHYCEDCGNYYYFSKNVCYVENVGYVCDDCMDNGSYHRCEDCGNYYADGDCHYNKYLECYQCFDCFEVWCNDNGVTYVDGDYFNAESGELIEDIVDFIDNQN